MVKPTLEIYSQSTMEAGILKLLSVKSELTMLPLISERVSKCITTLSTITPQTLQ